MDFNKNEKVVSDIVHNGFNPEELTDIMTKIGLTAVIHLSGSKYI